MATQRVGTGSPTHDSLSSTRRHVGSLDHLLRGCHYGPLVHRTRQRSRHHAHPLPRPSPSTIRRSALDMPPFLCRAPQGVFRPLGADPMSGGRFIATIQPTPILTSRMNGSLPSPTTPSRTPIPTQAAHPSYRAVPPPADAALFSLALLHLPQPGSSPPPTITASTATFKHHQCFHRAGPVTQPGTTEERRSHLPHSVLPRLPADNWANKSKRSSTASGHGRRTTQAYWARALWP